MNIAELWDNYIPFLYNKTYIESLSKFLQKNRINSILDCSCGTGFPGIDLKKKGFEITCSDKSQKMIKKFKENMKKERLKIPFFQSDWLDLDKKIKQKFDMVMCRGNSLIYSDSWDKQTRPKKESIEKALKQFYNIVKPRGLLYIDNTYEKDFEKKGKITRNFPEKTINGKKIKLFYNTFHDFHKKTRIWESAIFVNGKKHYFSRTGYLLTQSELKDMLANAGFKNIKKIKINGEKHFTVFLAKKN